MADTQLKINKQLEKLNQAVLRITDMLVESHYGITRVHYEEIKDILYGSDTPVVDSLEKVRLIELVLRMRKYDVEVIREFGTGVLASSISLTLEDAAQMIVDLGLDGIDPSEQTVEERKRRWAVE